LLNRLIPLLGCQKKETREFFVGCFSTKGFFKQTYIKQLTIRKNGKNLDENNFIDLHSKLFLQIANPHLFHYLCAFKITYNVLSRNKSIY